MYTTVNPAYVKLLVSEMRIVPVTVNSNTINDEQMIRAITMNQEIHSLGYTLTPAGIVMLAKSDEVNNFFNLIKDAIGDVKAKPMYPNFPTQVMDMDEATFRFHQLMHYFSTYGAELFTGQPVSKGWLPEVEDTDKIKDDRRLLDYKVIDLIDVKDAYIRPYQTILSRRERMTDKDKMILIECINHLSINDLSGVNCKFKENLIDVFSTIFDAKDLTPIVKIGALRCICQHTGDVYKCMINVIKDNEYHLSTSQKRMIVKLLESFPIADFRGNLMLSNKKREEVLFVLRYLDFNAYARKREYIDEVKMLRNKELRSWESGAKKLVAAKSPEALAYYAQRPGMMLRHITYLLRNGYTKQEIADAFWCKTESMSIQTIVSLMNFFYASSTAEAEDVRYILDQILKERLACQETVLREKKVYIDTSEFDLDLSELRITDKSSEGGYIRSGLAYKIPDGINRIRFFVYWNDTNRVDVDLHSTIYDENGCTENVGWDSNFIGDAYAFSGDITHSDAAEYIDIDLNEAAAMHDVVAATNINLYAGYDTFGEIDECYVGCMAVDSIGTDVKLYNPANCFFTHYLTGNYGFINYGCIDIVNRVIRFDGHGGHRCDYYSTYKTDNPKYSVRKYIDNLISMQHADIVDNRDAADIVLVMGKPSMEKEVSLIDNNFFMD
jgi:hypothetical protein